jgi:hypothetical protein
VGPRTDLDKMERKNILPLLELELWHLGRPSRSQSLYRLRCPYTHPTYSLVVHSVIGSFLAHSIIRSEMDTSFRWFSPGARSCVSRTALFARLILLPRRWEQTVILKRYQIIWRQIQNIVIYTLAAANKINNNNTKQHNCQS